MFVLNILFDLICDIISCCISKLQYG